MQGMSRKNQKNSLDYRLSNPKPGYTTGGSSRAAHGGATGRGGPGRFVRAGHNRPRALQGIEDNCLERLFGSTNKRNPI